MTHSAQRHGSTNVNCLLLLQLLIINNLRYSLTKQLTTFFSSCFYFYILTKGMMLCSLAFSIFVDIIIAYTLLNLGQEDSLEEGMATHSSILAWKIPWTEEPGGLQSIGSQRARHDWATNFLFHSSLRVKILFFHPNSSSGSADSLRIICFLKHSEPE